MSENARLHQRQLDAFNRRDLEAVLALADAEMEFSPAVLRLEGGRVYRGHDGLRRWWDDLFSVYSDFSVEVEAISDSGDFTTARLHNRGRGMESGAPMDQKTWYVVSGATARRSGVALS